jgi:NAD-dependent SIR2 family protein deacetylase
MTSTFYTYLISKKYGKDISMLSPTEAYEYIEKKTAEMVNNDLSVEYKKFQEREKELERETTNFWIGKNETIQPIIDTIEFSKAKRLVQRYKKVLVLAGAGMSQDSDVPVFRTSGSNILVNHDFSNAKELQTLFSNKSPHTGYSDLLKYFNNNKDIEYYIETTNIDNFFIRAGFDKDRVAEIHGNIYRYQCENKCKGKIYTCDDIKCDTCGNSLRPNVMLFNDYGFIDTTSHIENNIKKWIEDSNGQVLIIELGVGIHIPTLRDYSEILVDRYPSSSIIRVNKEHTKISDDLWNNLSNMDKGNRVSRIGFSCRNFLASVIKNE